MWHSVRSSVDCDQGDSIFASTQYEMYHCQTLSLLVYSWLSLCCSGQVDTAHGCYVMHWPGLLVLFPIAAQHAASWQDMQQGGALPLTLPDGAAPVASRLCIHAGNAGKPVCCAVLCCAVLCCAVLCCAVLCCAVLCCAAMCCAAMCCAALCVPVCTHGKNICC